MNEDLTGRRVYQGPIGEGQFLGTIRSVYWDMLNMNVSVGVTVDDVRFLIETPDGGFGVVRAGDVRTEP